MTDTKIFGLTKSLMNLLQYCAAENGREIILNHKEAKQILRALGEEKKDH